ncbi:hypothetical protein EDD21DRAFT_15383 [Dissophora ornata]|nr:hypothetical protein EDD21DRAFT_15383 [Dissophora ornata]
MASYTSPALPENRDSRTNPLRPVDYTPNHTYISSPHSANSDRKGQSLSQNQQQQWPQQHYPQRTQHNNSEQGTAIPRSNTLRDPAAQQRLAMQLEYQRSLAKISLGDEDNAIHTTAESYSHPTAEIYSHPSQSNYSAATIPTTSAVGQAMANLGLASPSSFSTHKHPTTTQAPLSYVQMQSQHIDSSAPIVYQPQQHQHHHQQQQGPLHVSMALNYPPAYTQPQQSPLGPGQPHHQHNQQQQIPQQRVLHQSHEQQPYYPDSALSPKIPSSYTGSQIYSPTFNSSTMSGSWSQSSLSSHTLGSYSTHSSIHGSFNSHYSHPPPLQLSTRAQLLIDFNPSILSTIAVAFRQQMLDNESKRSESESYGLEFPVTFTGKEAIDVLIELTKLQDRRHGLSIARSMEHQLLFFGGGDNKLFDSNNDQYFFSELALAYLPGKSDFPTVPTGVFPYSAKCYSYGCIPGDSTCYSYLCPNRRHIVRWRLRSLRHI